jgi:hypothetical protein
MAQLRRIGMLVATALLPLTAITAPSAQAVDMNAGCSRHPGVPDWFYPVLRDAAARTDDAVPTSWGSGDQAWAMMKIVCMESSFDARAVSPSGSYFGLGQLGRPAIDASRISWQCYYWVPDDDCARLPRFYQLTAALRYANQRYGSPMAGWRHFQDHNWW